MQQAISFATAAAVATGNLPSLQQCTRCHTDCRTTVTNWRGYTFQRPLCPTCANAIVLAEMKRQGTTAAKVLEN